MPVLLPRDTPQPPRTPPVFGISEQSAVVSQWIRRNMQETDKPLEIDSQMVSAVLVQPEMERGRFPLVSNSPFRASSL
jgi:hypothetical protein